MTEEPAFPCIPRDRSGQISDMCYGLTKREWFAGMALQGLLTDKDTFYGGNDIINKAWMYADKMMEKIKC